jgi:3-oxoacyl-[acyl-carrier-protein] synthase-3
MDFAMTAGEGGEASRHRVWPVAQRVVPLAEAPRAGILGTGRALPEGVLTNADLAAIVETTDEWIVTRTGVERRHRATAGDYTSQLAACAARRALERADVDPADVDIVVCATVTPDQLLPATACFVQAAISAHHAAAFDIAAACSGFLYGLTLAQAMILSGRSRFALVIGAELLTRYVDYADRSTCVLFGDGAGAVVLGPVDRGQGVVASRIWSDGRLADLVCAPGGGTRHGTTPATLAAGLHHWRMRGNAVFRTAVTAMTAAAREVLAEAGLEAGDVGLFIPHQANRRIGDAVAAALGINPSRTYSNIARYGNTGSASIPIALDECVESGRLSEGDCVLLTAFGGGVTWGAALMQWCMASP